MYILNSMASFQKKIIHGREYWYIVECRRVNGKPRPFVLEYLGNAEALLQRLQGRCARKKVKSYSHGAVYGLLQIVKELDISGILKEFLPKQKRDGLSVADTLLLGALHRAVEPGSKRRFSQWAGTTTLPKLMGIEVEKVTSQHFWDQMEVVKEEQLQAVENALIRRIFERYKIVPTLFFYDTTNFYTYIATENHRVKGVQRGHNKQKRNDLRQFNLALMTTRDPLLPLFSHVYEGNKNDISEFPEYLSMMIKRIKNVLENLQDITFVFDKGNNSPSGIAILEKEDVGYVGSLSIYSHKELIGIGPEQYHGVELSDGETVLVYRDKKMLWGKEHLVIVKKSEQLRQGQIRGFVKETKTTVCALEKMKGQLTNPQGKKRTKKQIEKQIERIVSGKFMKEVILVQIIKDRTYRSGYTLKYEIDNVRQKMIMEEVFGKKALFTNRMEWTDKEIIEAYHGQSRIEKVFRHLKNPYHLAVRPQFHWTDQKIRVHTFMCLLGLFLTELLRKKVLDAGLKLSLEEILDRLSNIRKSVSISYTGKQGKPTAQVCLEEMKDQEKNLWEIVTHTAV